MEFQKFGDTYVVRLDKGEEIVASLQALCEKQQIALASVEGIGAADHAVIGLYGSIIRRNWTALWRLHRSWAISPRKTERCTYICTLTFVIKKCRFWADI